MDRSSYFAKEAFSHDIVNVKYLAFAMDTT